MTRLTRRAACRALGGAMLGAMLPRGATAQTYPSQPLRIVHGYNSGTNPDVISRIISPALAERLGQPVLVEPMPGAAGRIAAGYVAGQESDGYTMIMLTAGDGVTAALDGDLSYDLLRDFEFVATTVHTSLLIVVGSNSPIATLGDLLEAGETAADGLTFGTPGIGTTQHLTGELLRIAAGINLVHIPYRENAFADLIGGRVDLLVATPSVSLPQISSGHVRAIAVTSKDRIDAAPDVPALSENDALSDFDVSSWLGIAVRAGTDQAVVATLSEAMRQVLADDRVREQLLATGSDVGGLIGPEFRARVEGDIARWSTLAGEVRLRG